MEKPKGFMLMIGKKEPPSLDAPGVKPKPKSPVEEGGEESAQEKLAYIRGLLQDCLAACGEDEPEPEMEPEMEEEEEVD